MKNKENENEPLRVDEIEAFRWQRSDSRKPFRQRKQRRQQSTRDSN